MSKAAKTAVDIISGEWGAQQSFHYGEALVCCTSYFVLITYGALQGAAGAIP